MICTVIQVIHSASKKSKNVTRHAGIHTINMFDNCSYQTWDLLNLQGQRRVARASMKPLTYNLVSVKVTESS